MCVENTMTGILNVLFILMQTFLIHTSQSQTGSISTLIRTITSGTNGNPLNQNGLMNKLLVCSGPQASSGSVRLYPNMAMFHQHSLQGAYRSCIAVTICDCTYCSAVMVFIQPLQYLQPHVINCIASRSTIPHCWQHSIFFSNDLSFPVLLYTVASPTSQPPIVNLTKNF